MWPSDERSSLGIIVNPPHDWFVADRREDLSCNPVHYAPPTYFSYHFSQHSWSSTDRMKTRLACFQNIEEFDHSPENLFTCNCVCCTERIPSVSETSLPTLPSDTVSRPHGLFLLPAQSLQHYPQTPTFPPYLQYHKHRTPTPRGRKTHAYIFENEGSVSPVTRFSRAPPLSGGAVML